MKGMILVIACVGSALTACADLTSPSRESEVYANEHQLHSSSVLAEDESPDSIPATHPASAGTIEGVVRLSESSAGLAKVTVAIHRQLGGIEFTTTTDASGRFRISGLQGGKHVVVISRNGYIERATPMITLPVAGVMNLSASLAREPKQEPVAPGGYRCGFIPPPLVKVDGSTVVTRFGTHDISAHEIRSLTLLTGNEALQVYGDAGRNGSVTAETRPRLE